MHFRLSTKHQLSNRNSGFTILEVLVTAAIIGVITAVVAFKYGSFNNAVLLKNQAYEIALDIREAQVIAVSSLGQQTSADSREFREDYGLYFNIETDDQRRKYIMFQDSGDLIENGKNMAYYDAEPSDEKIGLPRRIDSRFLINRICINIVSSSNDCPDWVDDISISFKRPNFDAQFASKDGKSRGLGSIYNVRLEIINPQSGEEKTQSIVVNSTGQIYVLAGDGVYFDGSIVPIIEPPPPPPETAGPPFLSVTLHKRLSSSRCTYNSSWGWDSGKIWVDNGCRATFKDDTNTCFYCDSQNYRYKSCTVPYSNQSANQCN